MRYEIKPFLEGRSFKIVIWDSGISKCLEREKGLFYPAEEKWSLIISTGCSISGTCFACVVQSIDRQIRTGRSQDVLGIKICEFGKLVNASRIERSKSYR